MKTPHLKKEDLISKNQRSEIKIDVSEMSLGRAASLVATSLIGKDDPQYSPFLKQFFRKVKVENIKSIVFTGNKMDDKKYYRYTGYKGNLKEVKVYEEFEKNPEKVFKRVVMRMLPKNKSRAEIIKNLKFA